VKRHCRFDRQISLRFENVLMAVPRRRQTNRKTGSRRAHDFITPKQLTFCPNCGKAARTHRVCDNCGYYMGRIAVKTAE
jgi:large subunit ribosomal protein L32